MPNPNKLFNMLILLLLCNIVLFGSSFALIFKEFRRLPSSETEENSPPAQESEELDQSTEYQYNGTVPINFTIELTREYKLYYEDFHVYTFRRIEIENLDAVLSTMYFADISELELEMQGVEEDPLEYALKKYSVDECGGITTITQLEINGKKVIQGTKASCAESPELANTYYATALTDEFYLILVGEDAINVGLIETIVLD